jgi:hypothetical protein
VSDHVAFAPWNGASGLPGADRTSRIGLRAPSLFRGSLTVTLTLPERARVELTVFDTQGRRRATLLSRDAAPGPTRVRWEGGESGVHFLRLSAGGQTRTVKVVGVR